MPATDDDFLRAVPFEVYDDMRCIDASAIAIVGIDEQLALAVEYVHRVVGGD